MRHALSKYPVWTAVITPFNHDNSIDFEGLTRILRQQEEANNGILLLGSTGEAMALSEQEKHSILDHAFSLNLKAPIMVGVGGIHLENTLQWISYLETKKEISAYLMVTPPYAKPGAKGQEFWFRSLLDRSTRPCMLYNVPGRTGCALNVMAIKALENHPQLWAVKEASGSISDYQGYKLATPTLDYYSGDDGMTPNFALYGCRGVVSVASNVWPQETHLFSQMAIEHRFEDLWPTWKTASESLLFIASNPIPVKALLHHLGIISSPNTRPPLSHLDLPGLERVTTAHELVKSWAKQQKEK